jgi:hypothetical protein
MPRGYSSGFLVLRASLVDSEGLGSALAGTFIHGSLLQGLLSDIGLCFISESYSNNICLIYQGLGHASVGAMTANLRYVQLIPRISEMFEIGMVLVQTLFARSHASTRFSLSICSHFIERRMANGRWLVVSEWCSPGCPAGLSNPADVAVRAKLTRGLRAKVPDATYLIGCKRQKRVSKCQETTPWRLLFRL